MPEYFDTHAHVNFKAFKEDSDEVVRRALDAGVWFTNVGTQVDTSRSAIELAHKYPEGVYAVIGLHPIHTGKSHHDEQELGESGKEFTSRGEIFDKDIYREFLKDEKVVALGECGLDYYHLDEDSIEKQKEVFIEQIKLANEIGKPLMIHTRNNIDDKTRNVYFDVYEILKEYAKVKGMFHFFAGGVEDMQRLTSLGFYISFAGPITYKPKPEICDYVQVVKETPLNMILTDTDSPYVAPVPYRGKRNEPVYVKEIVKKIADIKGFSEREVAEATVRNARKLFGI